MAWYHEIAASLATLVGRRRQDREMNEEMRFHLEMETKRHIAAGMTERDARHRAQRDFGGVERHKDDTRDERGAEPMVRRVGRRSLRPALARASAWPDCRGDAHPRPRHRCDEHGVRRREARAAHALAI